MKAKVRFSGNYNFTQVNTDTWDKVATHPNGCTYYAKVIKSLGLVMAAYQPANTEKFQIYEIQNYVINHLITQGKWPELTFESDSARRVWMLWLTGADK